MSKIGPLKSGNKLILDIRNLEINFKFHGLKHISGIDFKIRGKLHLRPGSTDLPEQPEYYWVNDIEKRAIGDQDIAYGTIHEGREIRAVDGATVALQENQSISIIGETSSGKTTLLLSIMNFQLPHITKKGGEINYFPPDTDQPVNLLALNERDMREYRGIHFGFIPQLAKESLNPWLNIGF